MGNANQPGWTPEANRLWDKIRKNIRSGIFYEVRSNPDLLERSGVLDKMLAAEFRYAQEHPSSRRLERLNVPGYVMPPNNYAPYDLATRPPLVSGAPIPGPSISEILNQGMNRFRQHVPPPLSPYVPTAPLDSLSSARSRPFRWSSNQIPPSQLQGTLRPDRAGQPGWGMEIERSRPFRWSSNRIPPPDLQGTLRPDRPGEAGWGMEIERSRPFDSSNRIPPAHLQGMFQPDRPGQPGWGMEITRSRPTSSLQHIWQHGIGRR